jgi:hypothetical protein
MRPLDHDKPYSDEDIIWIRQAGLYNGEDMFARNAERFSIEVPEEESAEDTITRSALDPSATAGELGPNVPRPIDPTNAGVDEDADDYDSWKVAELAAECDNREPKADVQATGAAGAVKGDYIKALRLWDQEHPEVFEDQG